MVAGYAKLEYATPRQRQTHRKVGTQSFRSKGEQSMTSGLPIPGTRSDFLAASPVVSFPSVKLRYAHLSAPES